MADFRSINPATGETVWTGPAATPDDANAAITAARSAAAPWANTPLNERTALLERFAAAVKERKDQLADAISLETGKPRWEARAEVDAMANKVLLSIAAYHERCGVVAKEKDGTTAARRFRPHGVLGVLGPFNMPGHIPNGHIVPAILAGNTVVFKPSEYTPLVAQRTIECWHAAGAPTGVINLIQGGRDTGAALVTHPGHDGLLFTGSTAAGLAMRKALADQPQRILALEMGGNAPLIVHEVHDLDAAAYTTIQSAYITAGQRCTCARRLIVPRGAEGDRFIDRLTAMIQKLHVGPPNDQPEPYMGPVISAATADRLLEEQDKLVERGGKPIVPMQRLDSPGRAMLRPGLIDMTAGQREDREIFGPLLQLVRVPDFDGALAEANRTAFGLAAGLLSDDASLYERFSKSVHAGVVSWNRPTTNASGELPFGGVGLSGNHRPSGYFAADYCSYAVAALEVPTLTMPKSLSPGIAV